MTRRAERSVPAFEFPYERVFPGLIASIMLGQREVVAQMHQSQTGQSMNHGLINRHISWLSTYFQEGAARHLFDGSSEKEYYPLRTAELRQVKKNAPASYTKLLTGASVLEGAFDNFDKLYSGAPTRFSKLVASSVILDASGTVEVRSPMAIALDFLTAPSLPGTRAFAWFTARQYLIEECFRLFGDKRTFFNPTDVDDEISRLETYFRDRFESRGGDQTSSKGVGFAGTVVRHFFAARDIFNFRFENKELAKKYLGETVFLTKKATFELSRNSRALKLLEVGETINYLFGIPIPIRGGDIVFRGGLQLASRGGLVMGVYGGPGAGKTSLALTLGKLLAPFGMRTIFVSAEESEADLRAKLQGLIPDEVRRLPFISATPKEWLTSQHLGEVSLNPASSKISDWLYQVEIYLEKLTIETDLKFDANDHSNNLLNNFVCRHIVVLDGIHDWLIAATSSDGQNYNTQNEFSRHSVRLREFIAKCRKLNALVIVTASESMTHDLNFEFLVDFAVRVGFETSGPGDRRKPDRYFSIQKARFQSAAIGAHGLQIAGTKGFRFSPQIDHQLDKHSLKTTQEPDDSVYIDTLRRSYSLKPNAKEPATDNDDPTPNPIQPLIKDRSHVFLLGEGSTGKAAFALKLAMSPRLEIPSSNKTFDVRAKDGATNKVLIVSFLYPKGYYSKLAISIEKELKREFEPEKLTPKSRVDVIHLYPGNYRPDQLFNRLDWELEAAEMNGAPYNSVVLDGLHNVFLQYPAIEQYELFWSQLYFALRVRPLSIFSTYTAFALQGIEGDNDFRIEDRKSRPLRDTLVQKTDYRIVLSPIVRTSLTAQTDPDEVALRSAIHDIEKTNRGVKLDWCTAKVVASPAGTRFKPVIWDRNKYRLIQIGNDQLSLF